MSTVRRAGFFFGVLAVAASAAAQTPFTLSFTQGGTTTTIANGSTLTLIAPAGQVQTLQVRALYMGSGQATIAQPPILTGASTLSAAIDQTLPVRLDPGQAFSFTVRYAPVSSAISAAQLVLNFTESPETQTLPITLGLQGLSSSLAVSYVFPSDQNVVPIGDNGTIPFPDTVVGGSAIAGLNITNLGSGPGQVTSIDISGSAFRLQNKPLLPATIPAGQNLQVQVIYRPTAQAEDTGTVTVALAGLAPITVRLTGRGVVPQLSYQTLNPETSVNPGDTITLPPAQPTETSQKVVRITNSGSASATISQIAVTGQGFQLGTVVTMPITLQPGATTAITVSFTPTRGGTSLGALLINADSFTLSGSGLAPSLTYTYVVAGNVITAGPTSAIIFSPVQVSNSSLINLTVRNTGTSTATISNIGITAAGTPFTLSPPPALPATIAPNGTLNVGIRFEPVTVGFASATLAIDSTNIPLSGSGTQPPALPAYTITAPAGNTAPLSQPLVGLKLAAPYASALAGTLNLNTASASLPSDPAVQFATGGRTIAFRIPANSTDAIFGPASSPIGTQIGLQTGTVAGAISLVPTFATQAGNIDLTPQTPTTAQFSVAAAAPSLLTIRITGATATAFVVEVTGLSTTRSLTSMNISFKTAPKFNMDPSSFTLNIGATATSWFQNAASQAFGGQFRVSIPFAFELPAGQSILSGITAVSATVSNATGTSQALETALQ